MTLRNLTLKKEYRSDIDDLVSEFFVPCLSNCTEYNRAVQYVTTKSISTLWDGFKDLANNNAKLRIVAGHRFKLGISLSYQNHFVKKIRKKIQLTMP